MRTPAGKECPQYYEDLNYRRKEVQECRLAARNPQSAEWHPGDCAKCALPDILRANASPYMRLRLTIKAGFLGLGRRNEIDAYCEKHNLAIEDPFVGCLKCNAERPSFDAFLDALENSGNTE
ncbi:MAG: hypothetical protein ABI947_27705 [Chloroflexota bacterium]